jgi:uncharacterized Zn finger protein
MLQDLIGDIVKERDQALSKAQSAKIFLELADPKRLARAGEILKGDLCQLHQETEEQVQGVCLPSDGTGEPYQVSFRVRTFRVRGASCTCHDAQAGHVCKHALALCSKWLLTQKSIWVRLGQALDLLNPQPNQKTQAA